MPLVAANVFLNIVELFALLWFVLTIKRLTSEWRMQHRLRTPAAAIYGAVDTLILQAVDLPFEVRMKIYASVHQSARELLDAIDAGQELQKGKRSELT